MKWQTFFINPFHGEELVIVHGAHVPHLTAQPLIGDGGLEMCDHDVPKTEKDDINSCNSCRTVECTISSAILQQFINTN